MAAMESNDTAAGHTQDDGDSNATRAQGFGSFLEMFQSASTARERES